MRDIANNLISGYQPEENTINPEVESHELLLVSDLLIHLVSEKKVQYQQRSVTFETAITQGAEVMISQSGNLL